MAENHAERHGQETFFVVGEGVLGGNLDDDSPAPVASAAAAGTPPFHFSRMGPKGANKQLGRPLRVKLAEAMAAGGGGESKIPSGFTYLGQFLDHDLTFDKTTVMLGTKVTPAQLLQGRSPSLDLDSLYGAGPSDPQSAQFYDADGVHLKMGKTVAAGGIGVKDGFDLPRGAGSGAAQKRRAVIPDKRNDENLAVAQTHLAMIRFHNRVVDTLPASVPGAQRFSTARELVTKHYQWMVRTDYLPRIAAKAVVDDVFNHGRKAFEVGAAPTSVPTMPIEFSIAAFRLGHSMVRRAYNWNRVFDDGGGTLDFLFLVEVVEPAEVGDPVAGQAGATAQIAARGGEEIPVKKLVVPPKRFNHAMRIDTRLVVPLKNLPTGSFGGPGVPFDDPRGNLAFRNLTRARMLT